MKCENIKLIIDEMIDKGHAEGENMVHEHLKICHDCRKYYDFWQYNMNMKMAEAPYGIKEKVMEKVLESGIHAKKLYTINPILKYVVPSIVISCFLFVFFARIYFLKTTVPVTFRINYENASKIALAGDFNGWNSNKMFLKERDGIWEVTVRLKPKRYQYVFVVDEDKIIPDPGSQIYVDDGFGQKNSVIDIVKI